MAYGIRIFFQKYKSVPISCYMIHLGISIQSIEVKEIGENEDEESHQNTSEERKENIACIKKGKRSRQTAVRAAARRQTGDGWMDVGFFDVNARGNTSSIMATTAVVNFYILRATFPSLEISY
jgi:hypothetical protein